MKGTILILASENEKYISYIIYEKEIPNTLKNYKIHFALCGAQELSSLDPFYNGPKVHTEEEETPKDEQRESKLPRDIAEDNPIFGQPKLWEGRAA